MSGLGCRKTLSSFKNTTNNKTHLLTSLSRSLQDKRSTPALLGTHWGNQAFSLTGREGQGVSKRSTSKEVSHLTPQGLPTIRHPSASTHTNPPSPPRQGTVDLKWPEPFSLDTLKNNNGRNRCFTSLTQTIKTKEGKNTHKHAKVSEKAPEKQRPPDCS